MCVFFRLICTDSLARGIDLPGIRCVISYSAPKFLKTYIHRAGRTARAGESGLAVTLLHNEQLAKFMALLAQSKKTDIEEVEIFVLYFISDQFFYSLIFLKKI